MNVSRAMARCQMGMFSSISASAPSSRIPPTAVWFGLGTLTVAGFCERKSNNTCLQVFIRKRRRYSFITFPDCIHRFRHQLILLCFHSKRDKFLRVCRLHFDIFHHKALSNHGPGIVPLLPLRGRDKNRGLNAVMADVAGRALPCSCLSVRV